MAINSVTRDQKLSFKVGFFLILIILSSVFVVFFYFGVGVYAILYSAVFFCFSICVLGVLFFKTTPFLLWVFIHVASPVSPIFWITLAGSLTSISSSNIVRHVPTVIFACIMLITVLECRTIDLMTIQPKILRRVFPRKRDNVFYLDTSSDVLTLSKWRTGDDWLFSGLIGIIQKVFIFLWFLSVPFIYLISAGADKEKYPIIGLFFCGIAIFGQPMLVKMWIYFRLALMKERGEI